MLAVALLALASAASGCVIGGTDSGQCLTSAELTSYLSFCADVVRYTACVPKEQVAWRGHGVWGCPPTAAVVQRAMRVVVVLHRSQTSVI